MNLFSRTLIAFSLIVLGHSSAMAYSFARLCPEQANKVNRSTIRRAPSKFLNGLLKIKGVHNEPIQCIYLNEDDDEFRRSYAATFPDRWRIMDKAHFLPQYDCETTYWYVTVYNKELGFLDRNGYRQRAVVLKSKESNVCKKIKYQGEDWFFGYNVIQHKLKFPEGGNKIGAIQFTNYVYMAQPQPEIAF